MLRKVALGHDAVSYLRTSLSEGSTLSRLLVSLPLDSGRITTFVPRTLTDSSIHNFTAGWSPNPGGVFEKVRNHVAMYVRTKAGGCAVFEDINSSPREVETGPPSYPYFVFDDEVYPFLTSTRGGSRAVRRVMLATYSYRFLTVLGDFADVLGSRDGQVVGEVLLRDIARRAEQLVVSAYDSDGCLIWFRT